MNVGVCFGAEVVGCRPEMSRLAIRERSGLLFTFLVWSGDMRIQQPLDRTRFLALQKFNPPRTNA